MRIFANVQVFYIRTTGLFLQHYYEKSNISFPPCIDLCEFHRFGSSQNLPVSISLGNFPVLSSFVKWAFRDEDIAAKCEGQCELEYIDCTQSCSDTNCLVECGRTLNDCINGLNIN